MRSASTDAITEIIQNNLISHNAKTELKIEVEVSGAWVVIEDLNEEAGVDWSESGKNQKYATISLTPLAGTIKFSIFNYNGQNSPGSGTSYEGYFENGTRVRLTGGYNVSDNLTETTQSINLNDIAGDIIKSFFWRTEHSGGTVILDPDGGTIQHFTDWFDPLYDSETYDDSTYTPDAYTVHTYDSSVPGWEQFNKIKVTANNTDGKIYYRTFDDDDETDNSISRQWTLGGTTINGDTTVDFDDIVNERFIQIAILYDGISWGEGQIVSDITVYYQSSIEWIYTNVYYLDTPSFDDPPAPINPMVYCEGRDIWKNAIETDVNISDYSGTDISPTDFIKAIADKCRISYSATSIDTITGFVNINWAAGFTKPMKGNKAFELIMQKINTTGYQMYTGYDTTLDDNILFVTAKPDTLVADGVFSFNNYINIGNNKQNSDKMLKRYTVISDTQTVDAEEELDEESINATGVTTFNWAGAVEAIYIRFEANLPDNITATVVINRTGATLTVTAITGTVVVTAYGCQWTAAPTWEGEAINFTNQINGKGTTIKTDNPLMTSDAECKTMAESFIADFTSPVQEAQGLTWPYVNLFPEINDVYMLWRRFIFNDNLYYNTKITHHWNRGESPNESTMFNLDDSGRNFDETSYFIYDQVMKWDRGFVWDMGVSTPLTTEAEYNVTADALIAASINVDFS